MFGTHAEDDDGRGRHGELAVLSAHFPSLVSRQAEELTPAIAVWGDLLWGHRISSTITEVDANMEFTEAQAERIGSALAARRRTRRTQDDEDIKAHVCAELDTHDLRLANTYKELYDKMDTPLEKTRRTTWRGKIFGNKAEGALDYIICDKRLCSMIYATNVIDSADLGFPCDHCALLTSFRFHDERTHHHRGHVRKPIGWVPHGTGDDYREAAKNIFEGILPIRSIAAGIAEAAQNTGAPRRRRQAAGWSDTERRLRRVLSSAQASDDERRAATDELWRCRHHIQIEKNMTMSMSTLEHLRGGGWGQQHVTARHACIPFLETFQRKNSRFELNSGGCGPSVLRVVVLEPPPPPSTAKRMHSQLRHDLRIRWTTSRLHQPSP